MSSADAATLCAAIALIPVLLLARRVWRSLRHWRPLQPVVYPAGAEIWQHEPVLLPLLWQGVLLLFGLAAIKYAISGLVGLALH